MLILIDAILGNTVNVYDFMSFLYENDLQKTVKHAHAVHDQFILMTYDKMISRSWTSEDLEM